MSRSTKGADRGARGRAVGLVAVLLVSLLATGCNVRERITERAVEGIAGAALDGDVDIDTDDGTLRVQTDDGTVEFGGGSGSLPDAFPDQFPVPDDAAIEFATSASTDEGAFFSVIALTTDSYEDTVSWYEGQLSSRGWSIDGQSQFSSGDISTQSFTVSGHGYEGTVTIHETEDQEEAKQTGIQLHLQAQSE